MQTCGEVGKQLPEKACRLVRVALAVLGFAFLHALRLATRGNEGSRVPGLWGTLRSWGHLGVSGTRPVPITVPAQSLHALGAKALKIDFPVDLVIL